MSWGDILKKILISIFLLWTFVIAQPTIGTFYFDGVVPKNGDTVSNKPDITVSVNSTTGVIVADFQLLIDGVNVLTPSPQNYVYDALNGIFEYKVTKALNTGTHALELDAVDVGGPSSSATQFFIASDTFGLLDKPLAYPSPATSSITIGYKLTASSNDVEFLIYSISGEMVYRRVIAAGSEGAHAGYNQVGYDLKKPDRVLVPNGVYICTIVSKDNGKRFFLGKTKFFVLR
jgi:hypothetical protein